MDEGHPIVAGTADLKYSNGLVAFQKRHPDRYVQFGISEQHMVSTAAGLATTGLQPYVATFASFMAYLACEQIRTDIAYTKQPVRLIGHHAGITLGSTAPRTTPPRTSPSPAASQAHGHRPR